MPVLANAPEPMYGLPRRKAGPRREPLSHLGERPDPTPAGAPDVGEDRVMPDRVLARGQILRISLVQSDHAQTIVRKIDLAQAKVIVPQSAGGDAENDLRHDLFVLRDVRLLVDVEQHNATCPCVTRS